MLKVGGSGVGGSGGILGVAGLVGVGEGTRTVGATEGVANGEADGAGGVVRVGGDCASAAWSVSENGSGLDDRCNNGRFPGAIATTSATSKPNPNNQYCFRCMILSPNHLPIIAGLPVSNKPATAPIIMVASVAAQRAFQPREVMSWRRDGTRLTRPPTKIPTEGM